MTMCNIPFFHYVNYIIFPFFILWDAKCPMAINNSVLSSDFSISYDLELDKYDLSLPTNFSFDGS